MALEVIPRVLVNLIRESTLETASVYAHIALLIVRLDTTDGSLLEGLRTGASATDLADVETSLTQTRTAATAAATEAERLCEEAVVEMLRSGPAYVHLLLKRPSAAFGTRVTIGRAPDNDVVLDDPSVSGHHASMDSAGDADVQLVWDHGSKNGTTVNGQRVSNKPLSTRPGARIAFGSVIVTHCPFMMLRELLKREGIAG